MNRLLKVCVLLVALAIPVPAGNIPSVPGVVDPPCTEEPCPEEEGSESSATPSVTEEFELAVLDILILLLVR